MKKLIIFDMDGTLYNFKECSFSDSAFRKKVLSNVKEFIKNRLQKTDKEADLLLREIEKEYGESISIALENKFNVDRYDFFNIVWDISAKRYIQKNPALRILMVKLKIKYDFLLVSDSPRIWINHVLKELSINDLFENDNIYSGEGDLRKSFNNIFQEILKKYQIKPENCISIGDQEETDILPTKKLSMKTVFVNNGGKESLVADYNVCSILEIEKALISFD